MKVNGQLELAQLEQIASSTTTPAATGRMYMDVTTPSAAVPRIYNGANWLPFTLGQATALVSQNSGTACTVDWSTGLYQQVVLTGHAIISFSNPQAGQTHTLVVSQKSTEAASTTPYMYRFNMTDQDSRRASYQPTSVLQSSANRVHAWFYSAGVRAAYATIPARMGAPATLPATASQGATISPDGKYLALGQTSTPFQAIYQVYDAGPSYYLGLKNLATPTATAAAVLGCAYSPDNQFLFLVGGTTPFIQGYWLDRGFSSTVLSNPGTLPTGAGQCIAVHPGGQAVGVGHTTTPFMSIYPYTNTGYGTKYTNPVTLPAAQVVGLAFAPCGDYLAAASATTPFLQVWPFDEFTGIGAILSNPGSLPAAGPGTPLGKTLAWRPQGDYVAMCMSSTPYLYIVAFNRSTGTFGASVSTTGGSLPAAATCVAWSPDGQYLYVGCGSSTFFYVFDFSGATIGTAVAYDGSNPGIQVNDIAVHPNGEVIYLALNTTPFVMQYPAPRKAKNYLRLNE